MISYTSIFIPTSSLGPSRVDNMLCDESWTHTLLGGTDICSLFAGQNTALPVFRGEIQCRMLGMAVQAFSQQGKPVPPGEAGELVCTKPFPCQPLGFWPLAGFGDTAAVQRAVARYKQSYFEVFDTVWCEHCPFPSPSCLVHYLIFCPLTLHVRKYSPWRSCDYHTFKSEQWWWFNYARSK